MGTLQFELNRLAGTLDGDVPTRDAQGAANVWAGTTGLALVGALNVKASNTLPEYRELQGVLNQLAGTVGVGVDEAATRIVPLVRTNDVPNPALSVDSVGWGAQAGAGTRVAQGTGWAWQIDGSVSAYSYCMVSSGVAGQFWSGSIVVSGPAGRTMSVVIRGNGSPSTSVVLTGTPQTVPLTNTAAADGPTTDIFMSPTADGGAWTAGQMLTATDALLEQVSGVGVPAGDYFDGDTPDAPPLTYAWTGTPGASTSTETRTP